MIFANQKNDLSDIYQSAYKKQHSIETALVHVQNDLLMALDSGYSVILLMLDLSAAFDTIDHSIMLHRLSFRFGIKEKALKWFESYLPDHRQAVVVNAKTSPWHSLPFGVPQGSVLGPILFTMYISPLGDLFRQHNVSYHMYADDTQLYLPFRSNDHESIEVAKSSIEQCVLVIKKWMASNFLKLNDDKTELLVVHPKHIETPSLRSIAVGDEVINRLECARNIGVMLDQNLNMEQQITTICKSAFFHIGKFISGKSGNIYLSTQQKLLSMHLLHLDLTIAMLYYLVFLRICYRNFNMYRTVPHA